MNRELHAPANLPAPLRGSEPGSFAEDTFVRRLPEIARRVQVEGRWSPQAFARLEALIADLPHGRLRPINDPGAPDVAQWAAWMAPYWGQTWLEAPWFAGETYFFRRVLEASGYFQNGPDQGVDPYLSQKRAALQPAAGPIQAVLEKMDGAGLNPSGLDVDAVQVRRGLAWLLRTAVWGNQADLSLWPADDPMPEAQDSSDLAEHLLVDEADAAAGYLQTCGKAAQVDFILDNCGLELAFDVLLADTLLSRRLAQTVVFHVKTFPTYVSDVTWSDVGEMLDYLAGCEAASLRGLAARMQAAISRSQMDVSSKSESASTGAARSSAGGRLRLDQHFHWVSPSPNWEMPADLAQQLAESDLVISKGDANYRRWLGDLHWDFTTPFQAIVDYRPAPLLAMRVFKSNVASGLKPGQSERMDRKDPDWLYDGAWGMIQFAGAAHG